MSSSTETPRARLAILISGQGSNMVAIAEACRSGQVHATVAIVIADTHEARGIARARELGLAARVVDRRGFQHEGRQDRAAFEAALATPAAQRAGAALLADEQRFIDLARSPLWLGEEHPVVES